MVYFRHIKMQGEKIIKIIELPNDLNAYINDGFLLVKSPKAEVKRELKRCNVQITIDDKKIILKSKGETKEDKKMLGTLTAHIKNMIKGSVKAHSYTLKICSGHFPMNVGVSGNKLIVKNFLGEKIPRVLQLKEGANVKVEGDLVYVMSADKEITGQVSADIEQLTRRTGYDPRVFQDGIYIISKNGKELK